MFILEIGKQRHNSGSHERVCKTSILHTSTLHM